MNDFLNNANSLMGIVSVLALVAIGFFAIAGVFNRARRDKESESNKVDDRLINLLKEQVDALERKVLTLETSSKTYQEKLFKMEARNEVLEQIFQGRDSQTQEFQKQGFEAMKRSNEILTTVKATNKNVERLAVLMEKHLGRMEEIASAETTVTVTKTKAGGE